jgi:hypothetical protein
MPQGKTQGVKDNSTLTDKVKLRARMLAEVRVRGITPVILETYGGKGDLFRRVYPDIRLGTVFERDPEKIDRLCWQRPTWAIYQGDSPSLLLAGIGGHQTANIVDVDPYGHPWDAINALFQSMSEGLRPIPDVFWLVVNDGARQYLRRKANAIWETKWLPADVVDKYGNSLELNYLEVVRILLDRLAASTGYEVAGFEGYYCGHVLQNTHYLARFER